MSKGDLLVERGAARLQELADRAAARGDGIGEWLSEELRNDAAFLRKLKPSLVKARAQGNSQGAPTQASAPAPDPEPPPPPAPPPAAETPPVVAPSVETQPVEAPTAQTQPMAARPQPKMTKPKGKRGGPPPVVIVGAAFVAGILLAKFVDWRGHAHPRD